MSAPLSLERVFTDPEFFAEVNATPVQRAICRVIEGLPLADLASDADVIEAFGGQEAVDALLAGTFRPKEVDILAAIRSGKSRLVAAHCFWSTQVVDVSKLKAGETPRYVILSVNLTSAKATFNHLLGTIQSRPLMRALLVGDPVGETLYLRHPTGIAIECTVASGTPGAANLVSVWLAGSAFEEFTRQGSESTGAKVNIEDALRTAAGRVLSGGTILSAGAPWAPFGFAFERHANYFGHPTPDHVVIKATGPQMNPATWTPEACADLERRNPDAYVTDVLAQFRDPSSGHLAMQEVKDAQRLDGEPLPPAQDRMYVAVCDPASRSNDFAFLLLAFYLDDAQMPRYEVALWRRWRGSTMQPLVYSVVLQEIRHVLGLYGLRRLHGDQYAGDAIGQIAAQHGIHYVVHHVKPGNAPELPPGQQPANPYAVYRNDGFEVMKTLFSERRISIPRDSILIRDLLSIRRRATTTSITYDLPHSSDGRHGDYAAALAMGLSVFPTNADTRAAHSRIRHLTQVWAGMAISGAAEEIPELRAAGFTNPGFAGPGRDVYARLNAGMPLEEAMKPTFTRVAEAHGFVENSETPIANPGAVTGHDEVLWNQILAGKWAEQLGREIDPSELVRTGDFRTWANQDLFFGARG